MAESEKQTMVHRAYSVIRKEGADPYWHEIGATFSQRDGKGLTLILQSLPLDGRVVLRELDAVPQGRRREQDEEPARRDDGERRERKSDYKPGRGRR